MTLKIMEQDGFPKGLRPFGGVQRRRLWKTFLSRSLKIIHAALEQLLILFARHILIQITPKTFRMAHLP